MGRLTRAPELRSTSSGKKVVSFSIAVNRRFKGNDEVSFLDCEAWDTGAETIAKYFQKGDRIIIHASIRTESWETPDGQKRSKQKFRVNQFEFVDGGGNKLKPDREEHEPVGVGAGEGDIPF